MRDPGENDIVHGKNGLSSPYTVSQLAKNVTDRPILVGNENGQLARIRQRRILCIPCRSELQRLPPEVSGEKPD